MFKIDKSLVADMNSNKSFIVITHKENLKDRSHDQANNDGVGAQLSDEMQQKQNELLSNADGEARVIIQNAITQGQQIKETAWQDGYNKGMDEAKKRQEELISAQMQEIKKVLGSIEEYKINLHNEMLDNVLQLSIDIAEKIVNIQLKRDDIVFIGIVKNAIAILEGNQKFVLRVSKVDFDKYFKDDAAWLKEQLHCGPFEVVGDASLQMGGCVIESENGIIDAGIDVQLNKIQRSLIEEVALHD